MQCPNCDHANEPDAKFCGRCGLSLLAGFHICPACGAKGPAPQQFCTQCGNRFDHNEASQKPSLVPSRSSHLQDWLMREFFSWYSGLDRIKPVARVYYWTRVIWILPLIFMGGAVVGFLSWLLTGSHLASKIVSILFVAHLITAFYMPLYFGRCLDAGLGRHQLATLGGVFIGLSAFAWLISNPGFTFIVCLVIASLWLYLGLRKPSPIDISQPQ